MLTECSNELKRSEAVESSGSVVGDIYNKVKGCNGHL